MSSIDHRFERARAYERAMYARLTPDGAELESYPATRPGAVLFVDLNIDHGASLETGDIVATIRQLRELSPVGLGNVSTVLLRWPDLSAGSIVNEAGLGRVWEQISESLQNLRMAASAGLLLAPPGLSPSICWGPASLTPTDEAPPEGDIVSHNWSNWLLACREIELMALLQHGRGMWKPRYYHYRLPSGRHSATFVRLGDAVRSVRDADVIAWWLRQHASEGLGIVLDTSTIVPIVLALRNTMATNDVRLGKTVTMASYPATNLEFTSAVVQARNGEHPILALLSVNSSGSVRERLIDVLQSIDAGASHLDGDDRRIWTLHTFVDKTGDRLHHLDDRLGPRYRQTSVWTSQGERAETIAEQCKLCNDPSRSRTVQIDPKSFDGLVLPDPVLVTPDIRVADSARVFWHLCDMTGALSFDDEPHESVLDIRPHGGRMGVVIDYDPLLRPEVELIDPTSRHQRDSEPNVNPTNEVLYPLKELMATVTERLKEQHAANTESARVSSRTAIDFIRSAELYVGLDSEFGRADGGGKDLVEAIVASWNSDAEIITYDMNDNTEHGGPRERVLAAEKICIFVLGVVTGTSIHRALGWIQAVRRTARLDRCDVGVFALHLRPSSWRAREAITNPFGDDRVVAAFESVFPDGASPMENELRFLDSYLKIAHVNSLPYYKRRRAYLTGEEQLDNGDRHIGSSPEDAEVDIEALKLGLALLMPTKPPENHADSGETNEETEEPSESSRP